MKLQNDRGGKILLQDIEKPKQEDWGSVTDAMEAALVMEKAVNTLLLNIATLTWPAFCRIVI